jgi:hypothetical protein
MSSRGSNRAQAEVYSGPFHSIAAFLENGKSCPHRPHVREMKIWRLRCSCSCLKMRNNFVTTINAETPRRRLGFDPRRSRVGFIVDEVTLKRAFSPDISIER